MNNLLLSATLLMVLTPPDKNLPAEFYQLPAEVRERATLIIKGAYGQGRTPCQFLRDGSRRWFLDSWINVKQVYRGQVGRKFININTAMLPTSQHVSSKLEQDHSYLVLLRPGAQKMKMIATRQGITFWDSLRDDEIVAIVELK